MVLPASLPPVEPEPQPDHTTAAATANTIACKCVNGARPGVMCIGAVLSVTGRSNANSRPRAHPSELWLPGGESGIVNRLRRSQPDMSESQVTSTSEPTGP